MKTEKWRVHCGLADCYYYLKEIQEDSLGGTPLIYCTYPERDLTNDNRACPYYRMDWQKKMKLVQEKIAANKAARMKAQMPQQAVVTTTSPPSPSDAKPDIQNKEEPQPLITPPDIFFEQNIKVNNQEQKPQDEQTLDNVTPHPDSK